jgi:hypothetical protein
VVQDTLEATSPTSTLAEAMPPATRDSDMLKASFQSGTRSLLSRKTTGTCYVEGPYKTRDSDVLEASFQSGTTHFVKLTKEHLESLEKRPIRANDHVDRTF